MMYLPLEWLHDGGNEKEIRELLGNFFDHGCLWFPGEREKSMEEIESRLKELGETRILEEWRRGIFAM